ncbi:hypothetical protein LA080_011329 [Diaporthe eres]|nr:hypothetical protein LA080_011329 [Diaporthe eres]
MYPSVLAVAETATSIVRQPDSCRPDRPGVTNAQLDPARKRLNPLRYTTPVFLLDLLASLGELTLLLVPIAGHASTTRHGGRTTLTRVHLGNWNGMPGRTSASSQLTFLAFLAPLLLVLSSHSARRLPADTA